MTKPRHHITGLRAEDYAPAIGVFQHRRKSSGTVDNRCTTRVRKLLIDNVHPVASEAEAVVVRIIEQLANGSMPSAGWWG